MRLLHFLFTAVTSVLLFNPISTENVSPKNFVVTFPTPIIPYIQSSPVQDINPDFIFQLIQSNFNILEITFNSPINSFDIIVDPQARLTFLQTITSSLQDLTSTLSLVTQQIGINIDNSIVDTINNEIITMYNLVSERATNYMLPLETSKLIIDNNFYINRFFDNKTNTIIDTFNNFMINIPIILQSLNHSLYDVAIRIENSNNYLSEDILASYNMLSLRLSDIENNPVQSIIDVVIKINTNICTFIADCNLYCKVWDKVINQWKDIPTNIYDMHQVVCKVPLNTQIYLKGNPVTIYTSEFLPIGVFDVKPDSSNSLSTGFIIFLSITCAIFLTMAIYACRKYYIRSKYGLLNDYPVSNYNTV